MLRSTYFNDSSTTLQLLIDAVDKNKVNAISNNEITILLISFTFKKSTRTSYPTFGSKKIFNLLQHTFTQAPIL